MIILTVVILITNHLYRYLALFFNDLGFVLLYKKSCINIIIKFKTLENYRTEEEYENFLITKIALFQCINAYGSLFYIAFYLKDMNRLQEVFF